MIDFYCAREPPVLRTRTLSGLSNWKLNSFLNASVKRSVWGHAVIWTAEIAGQLRVGLQSMDILNQYHHVFWFGDLNYRLDFAQVSEKPLTPQ